MFGFLARGAAVVSMVSGGTATLAADVTVTLAQPGLDRWVYPFNATPGYREVISVFSSLGQEDSFPPLSFDQRDAQMLLGFDLGASVPGGAGLCGYVVRSARLTLVTATDSAFRYDPTYDAYTSYPNGDADQGRPVELYGAAFRNGWQACALGTSVPANNAFPCYYEGTQSMPGPAFGPSISRGVRHSYPTDYVGGVSAGVARDVSNNVREGFDPQPFAVGQIAGLAAGALVPVDREMTFTLDVSLAEVQSFLRAALDSGQLRLMVTSLQPASTGGPGPGAGAFATFYAKEIGVPEFAARLELIYALAQRGDADVDGRVTFNDITIVLANLGATGGPGLIVPGDVDCNAMVTFNDVTTVLANLGAGN